MTSFRRILVPLDGSERAEWALRPAFELAEATHGELILLRSMVPVYALRPVVAGEYEWAWPEFAREQVRTETREYLGSVRDRYEDVNIGLRTLSVEGDAASVIVDMAEDEYVDLIVMSTHGWSGGDKQVMGSVTARVLHEAPCPVFVIRAPDDISNAVMPLDGSHLAERAVKPGLALAAALGLPLTLMTVNEPINISSKKEVQTKWENSAEGREAYWQNRVDKEQYLQNLAQRFGGEGGDISTEVIDGPAVKKILEFADVHKKQLVIMSTHGRTGLRRWMYGSVTAKVMRSTSSSMLIIRPPYEEYR